LEEEENDGKVEKQLDKVVAPGVKAEEGVEQGEGGGHEGFVVKAGEQRGAAGVEGAGGEEEGEVFKVADGGVVDDLFLVVPDKAVLEDGDPGKKGDDDKEPTEVFRVFDEAA